MRCPACGATSNELRVTNTSHTDDQVRRRRECGLCSQRFSTVEVVVKDGQRTSSKDLAVLPAGLREALTS